MATNNGTQIASPAAVGCLSKSASGARTRGTSDVERSNRRLVRSGFGKLELLALIALLALLTGAVIRLLEGSAAGAAGQLALHPGAAVAPAKRAQDTGTLPAFEDPGSQRADAPLAEASIQVAAIVAPDKLAANTLKASAPLLVGAVVGGGLTATGGSAAAGGTTATGGGTALTWLSTVAIPSTTAFLSAVAAGAAVLLWPNSTFEPEEVVSYPDYHLESQYFPADGRVEVTQLDDPATPDIETRVFDGTLVGDRYIADGYVNADERFVRYPVVLGAETMDGFRPYSTPVALNPALDPRDVALALTATQPIADQERIPIATPLPPLPGLEPPPHPTFGLEGFDPADPAWNISPETEPTRTPATTLSTPIGERDPDQNISRSDSDEDPYPLPPTRDINEPENWPDLEIALRYSNEYLFDPKDIGRLIDVLREQILEDLDDLSEDHGFEPQLAEGIRRAGYEAVDKPFEVHSMTEDQLIEEAGLSEAAAPIVAAHLLEHRIQRMSDLLALPGVTHAKLRRLSEVAYVDGRFAVDPRDTWFNFRGTLHEVGLQELHYALWKHVQPEAYGVDLLRAVWERIRSGEPVTRLDELDRVFAELNVERSLRVGLISTALRQAGLWPSLPEGAEIDDNTTVAFRANINTVPFEELTTITRIGPIGAEKIDDYRQHHLIRSMDQLEPEIGPGAVASLRQAGVWVREPIRLHEMTVEQMVTLGVRPRAAEIMFRHLSSTYVENLGVLDRLEGVDPSDVQPLRRGLVHIGKPGRRRVHHRSFNPADNRQPFRANIFEISEEEIRALLPDGYHPNLPARIVQRARRGIATLDELDFVQGARGTREETRLLSEVLRDAGVWLGRP